jgi:hypothetical protein
MMGEEAQSLCNEPVLTTNKAGLLIGQFVKPTSHAVKLKFLQTFAVVSYDVMMFVLPKKNNACLKKASELLNTVL